MEGTAQELHSLSSTFGFYALYHVRSHSGNMSDIWHLPVVVLLQSSCTSQHWQTHEMPVLLSLLPGLVYLSPSGGGCPGERCWRMVSHVVCLSVSWHTPIDCDMALTWNHAVLLQLGHSTGYAPIAGCFPLPVRPTKRHKSLSEPPDFRVSALPLKEEEKNDMPKMVWNKTEKNPVLTWTLITTGRTPPSPYYSV